MTSALKKRLIEGIDLIPSCSDYSQLLDLAVAIFHISKDAARHTYGLYTYIKWKSLLLEQLSIRLNELKQQEQCGIINTHKIVEVEAQIAELENRKNLSKRLDRNLRRKNERIKK